MSKITLKDLLDVRRTPDQHIRKMFTFALATLESFIKGKPGRIKIKKKDHYLALDLMMCIKAFDDILFPDKGATLYLRSRQEKLWPYLMAAYVYCYGSLKYRKERYRIYAPKFFERSAKPMGRLLSAYKTVHRKAKTNRLPMAIFLISVAAHEVRHRLQANRRVKMFSLLKPWKYGFKVRVSLGMQRAVLRFDRRNYQRQGKSPAFIKREINRKEFDATVIQNLVVWKLYRRPTLRTIIKTMLLQAN